MKKIIVIIFLISINVLNSQTLEKNKLEELKKKQDLLEKQLAEDKFEYERVYVEVGLVKPLGNLSNKFDISPSYGFWFRSRIKNDDYIDIGLNVMIPNQASPVKLSYNDSIFSLSSRRFGGNLGFRFAKVFPLSTFSSRKNIEWNTGFGVAALFYDGNHRRYEDIVNGSYDQNNSKVSYDFAMATILLSQGLKINFNNVGVQFNYQLTPYGLFEKRIEPNFGSQSIMFGIYYRQ